MQEMLVNGTKMIYNMIKTRAELTEQLKNITTNVVDLLGSD